MPTKYPLQFWGTGPVNAAHQAALISALGGAVSIASSFNFSEHRTLLLGIGVGFVALAVVVWLLPWQRWSPLAPAVLIVPGIFLLATTTLVIGGNAIVTGPFLLLIFVWVSLHFPVWVRVTAMPLSAAAYAVPLILVSRSNVIIGGLIVILPVLFVVATIVARQVETIERTRDELDRLAQWRAALTATLAHDVRSPLTTLELAVEALADNHLPSAQRRGIAASAQRQAERITRLATGLLDLERIDSTGVLRLDIREVNIREAIEDALGYLPAGQANVDVDPDLTLPLDRDRFEEIVFNLSNNAIRHAGPPVDITATAREGWVDISFRDHGPGVCDDVVPQLFTRFAGDGKGKSVGLGLWIVRQLARAHGGDARYEPADPGARFIVMLPTTRSDSHEVS